MTPVMKKGLLVGLVAIGLLCVGPILGRLVAIACQVDPVSGVVAGFVAGIIFAGIWLAFATFPGVDL